MDQWIKPALGLGIAFCLLVAQPSHAEISLEPSVFQVPDIGGGSGISLDMKAEQQQGIEIMRVLRRSRPIIEDPELTTWLQALGKRLAAHSPNRSIQPLFLLENNPAMNAHTFAGGVIAINTGLILNTQSESELAAVLAHELAHVSQRHIARMAEGQPNSALLAGLGVLAGAAVASRSPDAAQAIVTGTMAMQAHQSLVFSQRAEAEADRVGLRLLAAAGFNPNAMPQFLEKLDRSESSLYGDISKYLRSHPLSIDRLSDTRSRAAQLGQAASRENTSYLFAREKIRSLTGQTAVPLLQPTQQTLTQRYAQGLQAGRSGNAGAVVQVLGTHPRQLPEALLVADALNQLGRYQEASQALLPFKGSHQQQEGWVALFATSQTGLNQAAAAMQALQRVPLVEATSTAFLDTAQRIAQGQGQAAIASLFNAARSLRLGEYAYAKATAQQALVLPSIPAPILRQLHDVRQAADKGLANSPH